MEFADIDTAGGVINGTLDAMTAVSTGRLETKGHMLMLDSFNKIAAILPRYLS
jgi:putative sterol carrier protein